LWGVGLWGGVGVFWGGGGGNGEGDGVNSGE